MLNAPSALPLGSLPVILVTGCSSGIGLALAKKLASLPFRLIVTARENSLSLISQAGLEESSQLMIRPLDVINRSERVSLVREVARRWDGIDVLVNNAGIAFRSVIEHMEEADERSQLETNYFGPMELIKLVTPRMRARRSGKIINVSSVGGMMAMPTMGSYSASKFALEGASEALWYELKPWNISVSLIQPGFVHSNSFRHVRLTRKARETIQDKKEFSEYYHYMESFIERLMCTSMATPESIARLIVRTIEDPSPPLRVPATLDATLFSLLRRFLPRPFYHWLLYRNLPGISEWGPISQRKSKTV